MMPRVCSKQPSGVTTRSCFLKTNSSTRSSVRSPEEEATRVRLLHDIEEGASREELERAIDRAIANTLELGLKKYHREKEPELHMLDGKPLLTYEEVE